MSIMLALASSGGGQPLTTKVYTSSQTVTIPAGVTNLVLVSGQGSAGTPADEYYTYAYSKTTKKYVMYMDQGGTIQTFMVGTQYYGGYPVPSDYCDGTTTFPGNGGVDNYQQFCYSFADASYWTNVPATNGTAASGFGKTFPGGVAGPAVSQTFKDVAVTPGQQFAITVPPGGSISISYY